MKPERQTKFMQRQTMLHEEYEIYYFNEIPSRKVEDHRHDHYEFYFFLEGNVTMHIRDDEYPLRHGDIVITCPGTPHHAEVKSRALPYRRFVVWISKEYMARLCSFNPDFAYAARLAEETGPCVFHNDTVIFNNLQTKLFLIIEEMRSQRFGRDTFVPLGVADLLMELNRTIYEQTNLKTGSTSTDLLLSVLGFIDDHLDEDLSLQRISEDLFVSKYHISHVFTENMGLSVHQYITKKRVTATRDAILRGEKITEAWAAYGFRDYSSFYRAFTKEFGLSPKEYQIAMTNKLKADRKESL